MVFGSNGRCHCDGMCDCYHLGATRKKEVMAQCLDWISVARNWSKSSQKPCCLIIVDKKIVLEGKSLNIVIVQPYEILCD